MCLPTAASRAQPLVYSIFKCVQFCPTATRLCSYHAATPSSNEPQICTTFVGVGVTCVFAVLVAWIWLLW